MLELYRNIREKRIELKLSQEELAKRTGYKDRTSIAKIESGKVDLPQSKIELFAAALGTTASELMGWEAEEHKTVNDEIKTIAAHSDKPLTKEEQQKILDYAKFLISQRKQDGK